MRNIKVEVYKKQQCNCTTTETDLTCIKFDGDRYTPSKSWIHVSCGEFTLTPTKNNPYQTTYQHYEQPKINITKDGENVFVGSFDELCKKLSQ